MTTRHLKSNFLTVPAMITPGRPAPHCFNPDSLDYSDPGQPDELEVEIDSDLPDDIVLLLCAVFEQATGRQWILEQIQERIE